jgi:hypothetical protein
VILVLVVAVGVAVELGVRLLPPPLRHRRCRRLHLLPPPILTQEQLQKRIRMLARVEKRRKFLITCGSTRLPGRDSTAPRREMELQLLAEKRRTHHRLRRVPHSNCYQKGEAEGARELLKGPWRPRACTWPRPRGRGGEQEASLDEDRG